MPFIAYFVLQFILLSFILFAFLIIYASDKMSGVKGRRALSGAPGHKLDLSLPDTLDFKGLSDEQRRFIDVWAPGLMDELGGLSGTDLDMLRRVSLFSKFGVGPGASVMEVGAGGDYFNMAAVTSLGGSYLNLDNEYRATTLSLILENDFPALRSKHPHLGPAESVYVDGFEREKLAASSVDVLVMLGVLDVVSQGRSSQVLFHRMLDQSFRVLKEGKFFLFSSKDSADHVKLERDVERYAKEKDVVLRKVGNLDVSSFSPLGSVYVLESKPDRFK